MNIPTECLPCNKPGPSGTGFTFNIKKVQYGTYCIALSPDGRTLASANYDGTIKLWDAVTGQERTTFKGHTGPVRALAFSPDGRSLASGSYREIKLWDAQTGQDRATLKGHGEVVSSVCFNPDGLTLISCDYSGNILTWEIKKYVD